MTHEGYHGVNMKLYKELSARIGLKDSKIAPQLFSMLADETDARILLLLPATAEDIQGKIKLKYEEVEERLHELFLKGVVFPSTRTEPPTYRMCRDMVQFHDATILWKDAPQEFLNLWQEFMEKEWPAIAKRLSQVTEKPYTRIIPVDITLKARTHILDGESVREIINNARNLAVTQCTCRLTARKCDHSLETCIQVNRAADYTIARGTGRKIGKEEAMGILSQAEREGLIHVTLNRYDVEHFICNCCPCCCQTMPILIKGGIHVIAPSRFRAEIEPELCTGCGTCHERCYFGAISWTDETETKSTVLADKCMGCGLCQVTCPEDAIHLVETRPKEFIPGAE